ncbi:hypothetical protein JM946_04760 [Steroidobacter sp. S1-65]|uniref:Uncharacterized protein n=1 Tax=Steroidobacter gossypii TaxID=2805490 RepID=A0ABS1WSU0_9GAMM|nr:hypothetical protein [Steroidobacter gossypii]MBM0104040.1 hypothetical protein [Steroidobacter gossypii]
MRRHSTGLQASRDFFIDVDWIGRRAFAFLPLIAPKNRLDVTQPARPVRVKRALRPDVPAARRMVGL